MAHSITQLYSHNIFAVKRRSPLLSPEVRPRLFDQIYSIVATTHPRCQILALNGVSDHLHLLARLNSTTTISDFMRDIKAKSSLYLNREDFLDEYTRILRENGIEYADLHPRDRLA